MVKNLLVLRNNTSLKNSNEFFKAQGVDFYSKAISNSVSLDINLAGTKADIVLVTSQNALKAVQDNIDILKHKKVYCLNKHIAQKIKNLDICFNGWSNTKQLAQYLIENEDNSQNIIHLCADNANQLFYEQLKNAGFSIEPIYVYKTSFINNFDDETIELLKTKQVKYLMLFSAASIKALQDIFELNNLNLDDYILIAFSQRMAQNITSYYSSNSKLEEMLEIYKKLEKGRF